LHAEERPLFACSVLHVQHEERSLTTFGTTNGVNRIVLAETSMLVLNSATFSSVRETEPKMRPKKLGKASKLKLSVRKLPKVGTMSVIKGPGNLSTFSPPLEPAEQKGKQAFED
jgi:hypothetical protein